MNRIMVDVCQKHAMDTLQNQLQHFVFLQKSHVARGAPNQFLFCKLVKSSAVPWQGSPVPPDRRGRGAPQYILY